MIFDALSSVVPVPEAFGAAEATLARLRGYQQHFSTPGQKVPLVQDGSALERSIAESYERGKAMCPSGVDFDEMLDAADVDHAVIYTEHYQTSLGIDMGSNDVVARYVETRPERLIGLAGVDPWKDDAGAEAQRAVRELGLRGVILSPFKQRLLPTDSWMARVFSVCEQLGVPVFVHSGINWWVDTSYEVGHPRHIDALASSFPELKIVALHAGWPWVDDMVMVAWRHANVFLDISAHRPAHMSIDNSGWAPLLYWGNRMISDRVLFGSTWTLIGRSIKDLADEVRALPLKDGVIESWLHGNAMRLFGLQ